MAVEEEQPADVNLGGGGEEENGDDDGGDELKGFTRSEVTVIDTSCPGWKVDKLVFRKKNVWKVRERKPKNKSSVKKKRKGVHEVDDINGTEIRRYGMNQCCFGSLVSILGGAVMECLCCLCCYCMLRKWWCLYILCWFC